MSIESALEVLLAQLFPLGITVLVAQPLRDDWRDDECVDVRVRRRRQAVVVRRGDSTAPLVPPPAARRREPTLPGLDRRERQETLALVSPPRVEPSRESSSCAEPPPESRTRPVVLREDIDEQIVEEYRREAMRILSECRLSEYDIVVE